MLPNAGPEQFWSQSSFSYKCCCLTTTIIFLLALPIPIIMGFMVDTPSLTILNFQIWRLLTSIWAQQPNLFSILNIIFSFLWLHRILDDKKYSTIYRFFQIILINLQIHLLFNIICICIGLLFGIEDWRMFVGYGWFLLIVVYQFRSSMENPQGERRFCCLPFMIKNKYYPWVIFILLALLSSQFWSFLACGMLGYYQECVRKQMIIRLPLKFYQTVDKWVPDVICKRTDYVPVQSVKFQLSLMCCGNRPNQGQSAQNNNPFNNNNFEARPAQGPVTNFSSPAAQIGGNASTDFRNYWANKDQNSNSAPAANNPYNPNNKQFQIEPNPYPQSTTSYSSNTFMKQNDSYAKFNDQNEHTNQNDHTNENDGQQGKKKVKGKNEKNKNGNYNEKIRGEEEGDSGDLL